MNAMKLKLSTLKKEGLNIEHKIFNYTKSLKNCGLTFIILFIKCLL